MSPSLTTSSRWDRQEISLSMYFAYPSIFRWIWVVMRIGWSIYDCSYSSVSFHPRFPILVCVCSYGIHSPVCVLTGSPPPPLPLVSLVLIKTPFTLLFCITFPSHLIFYPCILKVGVKGMVPIIDGDFHKRVIVDDSFWTLEDGEFGECFISTSTSLPV